MNWGSCILPNEQGIRRQKSRNASIPCIKEATKNLQSNPYLRLARHDGDAVLASLQFLVADERPHVDRHPDGAILAMLHGHCAHRGPYNNSSSSRPQALAIPFRPLNARRTGDGGRNKTAKEREGEIGEE